MALYAGWIAAAILGGILVFFLLKQRRSCLEKNAVRTASFRGKSFSQVLLTLKSEPLQTERRPDGTTARGWIDYNYLLLLVFDQNDVCLGVEEEQIKRK